MTDLPLAADAVLDTYMLHCGWLDGPLDRDYRCVAAVLKALADQVVPVPDLDDPGPVLIDAERNRARLRLLDIAAELEGFG